MKTLKTVKSLSALYERQLGIANLLYIASVCITNARHLIPVAEAADAKSATAADRLCDNLMKIEEALDQYQDIMLFEKGNKDEV